MTFDVARGEEFDLTRGCVLDLIRSWMAGGLIAAVWVAFPCTTFSAARRPPLRSKEWLRGLPSARADPSLAKQLRAGDATLTAALAVASWCRRFNVMGFFENPHTSLAWQDRRWQRLVEKGDVIQHVLDFCAFGAVWRKRTRVMGIGSGVIPSLNRRCGGVRGICHTGLRHVILQGREGSQLRTKQAEAYPEDLGRAIAAALVQRSL